MQKSNIKNGTEFMYYNHNLRRAEKFVIVNVLDKKTECHRVAINDEPVKVYGKIGMSIDMLLNSKNISLLK